MLHLLNHRWAKMRAHFIEASDFDPLQQHLLVQLDNIIEYIIS